MVTPADFLRLPYDDSLSLAGAEYARKSLHYTYNRMRLPAADRLRKIAAGIAVELAFRRWLEREGVPHDLRGATPFTRRDISDIFLGGRHCDVKSFFLTDRAKIRAVRGDSGLLLGASALVPSDQLASESMRERDVYVFGFLLGLETRRADDVRRAAEAGRRLYLLHAFEDAAWTRPADGSLGKLALKSNAKVDVGLEVGGRGGPNGVREEQLMLAPRRRAETRDEFQSLLYLKTDERPDGEIGVHSPTLRETRLVKPEAWMNIWIYGMEIILAGWLTKGEFRRRSRRLAPGSPTFQYSRTATENRAVPVRALRPMEELKERIRALVE